ncbi:MAG: GNAT family N-acetyltransferase [Saprospiraceae bacterium]|nr:GNAT family N-acetyltransferase [Saprospiraceae bacterium]
MTFSQLTTSELDRFAASEAYRRMPVLPISLQRAVSYSRNPRAQPNDVVLVLAWSDNALIGYLGALPDWFFFGEHPPERMAWLSCLWIAPSQRGKGLAKKLLNTMLEAWQNRVVLTEFTPEVKHLYARSESMTESPPTIGFRSYLRPNLAQILPPKKPFFEKIKPLLSAADVLLSVPNVFRIKLLHRKKLPCQIRNLQNIDEELAQFIAQNQQGELARRDRAALNWMLQYPWVIETTSPDDLARRYHFTSTAREFKTLTLQLLDSEQQTIGVLILTLRDGHLRAPHAWHADEHSAIVTSVIFAHAIRLGAKMLTLYHPRLVRYCNENRTPFFWQKALRRTYFVGHGLSEILSTQPLVLQDGDGDAGFT